MEKKRQFEDIEFEDYGDDKDDEEQDNIEESDDEFEGDEVIEEEQDDDQTGGGEEGGDAEMDDEEEGKSNAPTRVWRPGVDALEDDEYLTYDSTAYDMMHSMTVEWPCLSFQPLKDTLGNQRNKYPHTMYMVAGTQADQAKNNRILVMKISELHKTKHDEDEDDDASDVDQDDDEDENIDTDREVELVTSSIPHNGCVNRIRAMDQQSNIVATWSDSRQVYIWDIQNNLKRLDTDDNKAVKGQGPIHVVSAHTDEGYALDWSPIALGRLASGDCAHNIHVTSAAGAAWKTDTVAYKGHTGSVEDIQWSPSEESVFASSSTDKSIKIWDIRQHSKPAISVQAHDADVNVISWSRRVEYLIVSGCDDGSFRVWDLRNFKSHEPVSHFNYHTGPITSIQWNPWDESQVIVASADNQVTIWDFSLEEDTEEFQGVKGENDQDDYQIPPQLFFIHQGQSDVKEVHWHPQIPHVAVTTSFTGFNIFKSSNAEEQ
ncbi:glutamate-rich WD repeat-containing protein 1 [Cavenderia fasciculata]|uniref:Glutamate-rich WD repeat-containing protein 1 n=1 Tax=Cavenderia fasciculata TaxID=261658 RepID=F4PW22_CACFS|nr:glutamate-rich WD repeat-containing protein 1 [Cavenderia fasciculata]EGG20186.1 glutamate-rich WD repeat-containing protein 1 [Cavenderia fasciculata]|eukprot:XP_004367169.1 glutamate-rich WD repeat-containing protein 1 [Cavenderia fasciculata]